MTVADRPPMAVLIPTAERPELLARTLEYLQRVKRSARKLRIIVIENGARRGVEDLVRASQSPHPMEYRFHPEANKSAALNAVLEDLPDCLAVFFDDDVRVDPHVLVEYDKAAGATIEGRFFGGGLLVDYEEQPPEWLMAYLPPSTTGWHPRQHEVSGEIRFIGPNWAAFSRDLRRCGGFNPMLGPGSPIGATGQETEMQVRLVDEGVRPEYLYDALVWHYVPKERCSPQWAVRRGYRMGVSRGYLSPPSPEIRTAFGVPLWLLRKMVAGTVKLGRGTLFGSHRERFRARFKLMEYAGTIRGHRYRARGLPSEFREHSPDLHG